MDKARKDWFAYVGVEDLSANANIVEQWNGDKDGDQYRYFVEQHVYDACKHLLTALDIDHENDHNTKETANRMAKMFVHELFRGKYYRKPDVKAFPNVKKVDQMFVVGPIDIKSMCAHHFLPFVGQAWVGVLPDPDGYLLGLSKYSRLADWIFSRPQIQEEATEMLADELMEICKPRGTQVVVRATHMCAAIRGVEKPNGTFVTSAIRGLFRESPAVREEFLTLIKGAGF